jgi:long-subunit fatty acid transport protein
MKFLKYIFIILTYLPLFAGNGSVYSRFGYGELINTNSARRLGMGGLGSAVTDAANLGSFNPAGWHTINLMRFDFGLNYQGINASTTNYSTYSADYSFSGFTLGIPVQKDYGIAIVGGLQPVTEIDYSVVEELSNDIIGDYNAYYKGNGGLSKAFIGASYITPIGVVIGGSFDYFSGKIEYSSETEFRSGVNLSNTKFTNQLKNRGAGFTAGIMTPDMSEFVSLGTIKDIRFAASLSYVSKLNADTAFITSSPAVGSKVTDDATVEVKIPMKLAFGLSFKVNNRYLIALDYLHQPWSKYEFNGSKSPYLRDLMKISAGMEYADRSKKFGSFWEQMIFRCGLSYEQTQYEINNEGINQYSIHGGASFPISPGNSLDIGLQFGIRGTTDSDLIKENIYRATVTLSFGELWFMRQER